MNLSFLFSHPGTGTDIVISCSWCLKNICFIFLDAEFLIFEKLIIAKSLRQIIFEALFMTFLDSLLYKHVHWSRWSLKLLLKYSVWYNQTVLTSENISRKTGRAKHSGVVLLFEISLWDPAVFWSQLHDFYWMFQDASLKKYPLW